MVTQSPAAAASHDNAAACCGRWHGDAIASLYAIMMTQSPDEEAHTRRYWARAMRLRADIPAFHSIL